MALTSLFFHLKNVEILLFIGFLTFNIVYVWGGGGVSFKLAFKLKFRHNKVYFRLKTKFKLSLNIRWKTLFSNALRLVKY